MFEKLYDTKLLRAASSVNDNVYKNYLIENNFINRIFSGEMPIDSQDAFLSYYPQWIASSKLNRFIGLEKFPHRYISCGVTQSIDDWHLWCKRNSLSCKMFLGEYPYSHDVISANYRNWLEIDELSHGDAVLVSCPFSATGDIHPLWGELMDVCDHLNIPVFVDCAFFGACYDITVNLNRPCINTVSFSPTKSLCCDDWRSGICFTRRDSSECSLGITTHWHHNLTLNTTLCYLLMQQFSPDYMPQKWMAAQEKTCKQLGLQVSKTVHLGIGDEGWNYFSRDGLYNRVNIRELLFQ